MHIHYFRSQYLKSCKILKKTILLLAVALHALAAMADSHIKYYFNRGVDTTVATGVNAIGLNNCIADTLAAYLNRAQYSLDICVYDFDTTLSYNINVRDSLCAPKVAAAIDSAYRRGVKVRYIYEASNSNTGRYWLDTGIHTLGSPQGADYTIMHNKFVVIDAASPNAADPIVWTGCMNWYYEQFNWDYNNVVIVQDSALAHAYTAEFNMMWGDTGLVPNTATSKFGQYKTDLGLHNFTIDGKQVELYFSPSDGTDNHIQSTISSADKDLYFGMYTFTEHTDADLIVSKKNAGLTVYGIEDSYSGSYYPAGQFNTYLGTADFEEYTESADTLYHNKFLVVDPSDTCSDPTVLTGSHNWSASANTKNDENTLIIHDATAANLYLQYFKRTFNMLGGTMALPAYNCLPNAVPATVAQAYDMRVFPNPAAGAIQVAYTLPEATPVEVDLVDITGRTIASIVHGAVQPAGEHRVTYTIATPGLYWVRLSAAGFTDVKKVVVE